MNKAPWKKWGPYLSERQWARYARTIATGAGITSLMIRPVPEHTAGERMGWPVSVMKGSGCASRYPLWNGKDPILKGAPVWAYQRRGHHGEDVDRYFDVFVEYAKAAPEEVLVRCTVHNRATHSATLALLPRLWCRNEWSWHADAKRPTLVQIANRPGQPSSVPSTPCWARTTSAAMGMSRCCSPRTRRTRSGSLASQTNLPIRGASHQTGWTGVIARAMHRFAADGTEHTLRRKTTQEKPK